MPRKAGPIVKRPISNVKKVLAVASGKGGVGKSTIALNLAFALALLKSPNTSSRLRVGILDLDVFGPSIPTLMGLRNVGEPGLTESGAIIPLTNHGLPCMSMGFLLPSIAGEDNTDTPIVWRGLMVQKAVQQLLFDVDWTMNGMIDMPPGTGDYVGAVIVSTPQDVALSDVRKGISMFRKVSVPITGLILNQSHYLCPTCTSPEPQYLFGKPDKFRATAHRLDVPILGELPLVQGVSTSADGGWPFVLGGGTEAEKNGEGGRQWKEAMSTAAESVCASLGLH
ncbi:P-loop containing nucleoside triphosphate hydrolase protein [Cyathus striatus]|nr:P-loop containing nucleoside triphosphate hydrolase protein [Cyathus striatus]